MLENADPGAFGVCDGVIDIVDIRRVPSTAPVQSLRSRGPWRARLGRFTAFSVRTHHLLPPLDVRKGRDCHMKFPGIGSRRAFSFKATPGSLPGNAQESPIEEFMAIRAQTHTCSLAPGNDFS